jgi:hypothetical protein
MIESHEVCCLGRGRVGLIGTRVAPHGVGSTWGEPAPTHAGARGNRSRGHGAGIGCADGRARGSVAWSK